MKKLFTKFIVSVVLGTTLFLTPSDTAVLLMILACSCIGGGLSVSALTAGTLLWRATHKGEVLQRETPNGISKGAARGAVLVSLLIGASVFLIAAMIVVFGHSDYLESRAAMSVLHQFMSESDFVGTFGTCVGISGLLLGYVVGA